jgi:hypothetical protein
MQIVITDDKRRQEESSYGYMEFELFFNFGDFCFGGNKNFTQKNINESKLKENIINNIINNGQPIQPQQLNGKQTYLDYVKERLAIEKMLRDSR